MSIEERYTRNTNSLTEDEVKTLHKKRVAIIGLGGLGGHVAEHLARVGVKSLTVVDGDVFDTSNLNRQILSTQENIGKSKAREAEKRLHSIDGGLDISVCSKYIDKTNYTDILSDIDLIIDALDTIHTRFILRDMARDLEIPIIHGSIGGWYGQVSTIFPKDNTLDKIYKTRNKSGVEEKLGNLGPTAGLVASIQSAEAIKVLLNKGEILRDKVLRIDILYNDYELIDL